MNRSRWITKRWLNKAWGGTVCARNTVSISQKFDLTAKTSPIITTPVFAVALVTDECESARSFLVNGYWHETNFNRKQCLSSFFETAQKLAGGTTIIIRAKVTKGRVKVFMHADKGFASTIILNTAETSAGEFEFKLSTASKVEIKIESLDVDAVCQVKYTAEKRMTQRLTSTPIHAIVKR